jgi:hypothetical protein
MTNRSDRHLLCSFGASAVKQVAFVSWTEVRGFHHGQGRAECPVQQVGYKAATGIHRPTLLRSLVLAPFAGSAPSATPAKCSAFARSAACWPPRIPLSPPAHYAGWPAVLNASGPRSGPFSGPQSGRRGWFCVRP